MFEEASLSCISTSGGEFGGGGMGKRSAVEMLLSSSPDDQKAVFLNIVMRIHMDSIGGRPDPRIEMAELGSIPFRSIVSRPAEIAVLLKTLFSAAAATTRIEILRCGGADDVGKGVGLMLLVDGAPALQLGGTENGGIIVRQILRSEQGPSSASTKRYKTRAVESWSRH